MRLVRIRRFGSAANVSTDRSTTGSLRLAETTAQHDQDVWYLCPLTPRRLHHAPNRRPPHRPSRRQQATRRGLAAVAAICHHNCRAATLETASSWETLTSNLGPDSAAVIPLLPRCCP
jgi:hypothetical protein